MSKAETVKAVAAGEGRVGERLLERTICAGGNHKRSCEEPSLMSEARVV